MSAKSPSSTVVHFGPGESSEDAVMMNTPVVKAALEMGFSRILVRQMVQRQILATGENYRTVSDLVIGLLDAEDEMREEQKEQAAEDTESGTNLQGPSPERWNVTLCKF